MLDQTTRESSYAPGRPVDYSEREALQAMAPTPSLPNKIRDIHIVGLNHGYVVTIGCQNFAIEKGSDLIAKLSEYIHQPLATEQKWNDGKLF